MNSSREVSGVLQAWQGLHRLLPISLCLILFYVASGSKRERLRVMPYLGIFGALLGRLAPHNEVGAFLDDYFQTSHPRWSCVETSLSPNSSNTIKLSTLKTVRGYLL